MKKIIYLGLLLLAGACAPEQPSDQPGATDKPNIIIILADDMGYSDVGCFGSEINTPYLDKLAREGLTMTHFYNAGRCCPSRASLLSGLYPHKAGIGGMTDQNVELASYQGYFKNSVVTIADVLKAQGCQTYTSGKWHVGYREQHWPLNHGFDHCYSFIHGASSYFDFLPYRNADWPHSDGNLTWVRDNQELDSPDTLIYTTDLYTDEAIRLINRSENEDTPFFLYLAYNAPHWPLHALPEDIAKYKGVYDIGYDSIRLKRYRKMVQLGILPTVDTLSNGYGETRWDDLDESTKQDYASKMEVYAAMVDRMDQNIGRLVKNLEQTGKKDNTLIIFLSDNGGARTGKIPYLADRFLDSAKVGTPSSFEGYGVNWANVSNVPFRRFKAEMYEGGIATPFIAWYPELIKRPVISHEPAHLVDLLPTLLELAGGEYPAQHNGEATQALDGQSVLPLFSGQEIVRESPLFFEHYGGKAIRRGDWKLVKLKSGEWELFNMVHDRSELHNLVDSLPEMAIDLKTEYKAIAERVGAFDSEYVKSKTIPYKKAAQ
ncbi:MAG: arylsulfatase [Phaeodactylibacter sp.]|uniref:arylsulfatase n=1 Tax=Phaeodactylibacter sp. TaxID=1940289 RepID=UPI0032ED89A7